MLACLCAATADSQTPPARKPLLPLEPSELLKLAPPPPAGWTLTQSNAKNSFVEWLSSQATREFQKPNPATAVGAKPAPPPTTIVRLIDTGYFPAFNGDFENFRVGKYGNAETLMISGLPARKFSLGSEHERVRVSIRGRFIVEIEARRQPLGTAQSWLRLVNLQQLTAVSDSSPTALPKPIQIKKVDELDPKKNATSELFWSGPVGGNSDG